MNDGKLEGKAVVPASIVNATLAPSIALPNTQLESRGYGEILNAAYGMGRQTRRIGGTFSRFTGGTFPASIPGCR